MTESNTKPSVIMKAALKRLPLYYAYLHEKKEEGLVYVSSTMIANSLNLNSIQVRKDLAYVSSCAGKPKIGFELNTLLHDLTVFLRYDNTDDAIIVGAGRLGRTLLSYSGFDNYGLNILAAFDVNEDLVGMEINGKMIFPLSKLENIVRRMNINIGIITVPGKFAQEVANILVKAGIKAIWNFAPVHIETPNDIIIKNENLAVSLAALSHELSLKINNNQ